MITINYSEKATEMEQKSEEYKERNVKKTKLS